jgi:hypothetical protein
VSYVLGYGRIPFSGFCWPATLLVLLNGASSPEMQLQSEFRQAVMAKLIYHVSLPHCFLTMSGFASTKIIPGKPTTDSPGTIKNRRSN